MERDEAEKVMAGPTACRHVEDVSALDCRRVLVQGCDEVVIIGCTNVKIIDSTRVETAGTNTWAGPDRLLTQGDVGMQLSALISEAGKR